jgi:hypothetical protein
MLKRGELTGERTAKGWLAIPGGQVEYAKIKWEEEQAKFARVGQPRESSGTVSSASLPNLSTEALDSIRQLVDRVAQLEEIVTAQNARIASLEKVVSNAPLHVPMTPIPVQPSQNTTPISEPPIRRSQPNSPIPSNLPPGTLHSSDFADQLGIKRTVFDSMMKNGIGGEELERTKVPIVARPGQNRNYFTPSEQEKALALLRKHGKLPDV